MADAQQMDCPICNGPRRVAIDGICCGCSTKIAASLVVSDFACVHHPCPGRLQAHETRCINCMRSQDEDDVIPFRDIEKATQLKLLPQLQFVAGYYAGFKLLRKELTQADVCKFVWLLHKLYLTMKRDTHGTNRKAVMHYASLYPNVLSVLKIGGIGGMRSIGDFQEKQERTHVRKFLNKLWATFQSPTHQFGTDKLQVIGRMH